jgi:hypothetical protein
MPTNRSTDGITLNKVMVTITGAAITLTFAIGSFEYVRNLERTEIDIKRIESAQYQILTNLQELIVSQKVDYAQQMNMQAEILRNKEYIDKLENEIKRMKR